MLSILSYSVNAVFPLLLLVLLGYFLRQIGFFTPEFLRVGNRYVFKVAIPANLFLSIYAIRGFDQVPPGFLPALVFSLLALLAAGCLVGRLCTHQRNRRAVLVQAMVRSNYAAIGLSLAESLAGSEGASLGAVASAFVVIFYNVTGVVSLSLYGEEKGARLHPWRILRDIFENPLILGILFGLGALGIRALLPVGSDGLPLFSLQQNLPFLYSALSKLGATGIPLALLVMGGQFRFDVIGGMLRELIAGVLSRNLIAPCLGFGVVALTLRIWGVCLPPAAYAVFAGAFCSPLAVATTVMCAEMGADDQLAGQLVVWSSIGSFFSMLGAVALLRSLGLL